MVTILEQGWPTNYLEKGKCVCKLFLVVINRNKKAFASFKWCEIYLSAFLLPFYLSVAFDHSVWLWQPYLHFFQEGVEPRWLGSPEVIIVIQCII